MFSGSMLTRRLVLGNLLLFLALGLSFKSTNAEETTTEINENTTIIPLPNNDTMESMLSSEITSAAPEYTVSQLQTEADLDNPETTLVNDTNTMFEEPTGESTPPLSTNQTSPESVPESTIVQTDLTSVTTPTLSTSTLPVNVETTVIEQITSDTPSTSQYETTVGFTSPESTSPTERPTDELTTAAVAMTTDSSEALNSTSILTTPPADWTESPSIISDPVDTSTVTSTTTSSTSASESPSISASTSLSASISASASTTASTSTSTSSSSSASISASTSTSTSSSASASISASTSSSASISASTSSSASISASSSSSSAAAAASASPSASTSSSASPSASTLPSISASASTSSSASPSTSPSISASASKSSSASPSASTSPLISASTSASASASTSSTSMSTLTSASASTSTSTTQLPQNTADYPSMSSDEESVSTHFTTTATSVIIEGSFLTLKSTFLLIIIIIIVSVAIIFALCVGIIVFTQRRRKTASRNFSPMYTNGQSKRVKKKQGVEDDAWAGPVRMEVGDECDSLVQEGLMSNNGKQDGDDMVFSTFTVLDAGHASNGLVDEEEPLFYIDEDVDEDKAGQALEESEKQNRVEKREVKKMSEGETFCLTTAV